MCTPKEAEGLFKHAGPVSGLVQEKICSPLPRVSTQPPDEKARTPWLKGHPRTTPELSHQTRGPPLEGRGRIQASGLKESGEWSNISGRQGRGGKKLSRLLVPIANVPRFRDYRSSSPVVSALLLLDSQNRGSIPCWVFFSLPTLFRRG